MQYIRKNRIELDGLTEKVRKLANEHHYDDSTKITNRSKTKPKKYDTHYEEAVLNAISTSLPAATLVIKLDGTAFLACYLRSKMGMSTKTYSRLPSLSPHSTDRCSHHPRSG